MSNNHKLIFLYLGMGLFVFVLILFLFFSFNKGISTHSNQQITPTIINLQSGIKVLQTSPSNKATDVSINTSSLEITFNNPVSIQQNDISILPTTEFSYHIQGNELFIIPTNSLISSSHYAVTVKYSGANGVAQYETFTFTTTGPTPTPLPSSNDNYSQQLGNFIQTHHPELVLVNNLPYQNENFSAIYIDQQNQPFKFVVSSKNGNLNSAKQAFISWAESLGITPSQLNSLDITYQ